MSWRVLDVACADSIYPADHIWELEVRPMNIRGLNNTDSPSWVASHTRTAGPWDRSCPRSGRSRSGPTSRSGDVQMLPWSRGGLLMCAGHGATVDYDWPATVKHQSHFELVSLRQHEQYQRDTGSDPCSRNQPKACVKLSSLLGSFQCATTEQAETVSSAHG